MTTTATKQDRLQDYIAYATTDVQIDEDEHGTFAMMLSAQSDVKRYKVRVQERKDGSMFAESCVCPNWCYNNRNAVCCKHMVAFNTWHMNIHRSVTVMPVAEAVEMCAMAAPQKRERAPHRAPSTEGRRGKSAMTLNGKRECDRVTAYDAGWEAGKTATRIPEELVVMWMEKMKADGYTLRAQQELREQWMDGYSAGQATQPAPATDTTARMERATLSSAKMPDWVSMLPSRQMVG